jgi:hypothetical protein
MTPLGYEHSGAHMWRIKNLLQPPNLVVPIWVGVHGMHGLSLSEAVDLSRPYDARVMLNPRSSVPIPVDSHGLMKPIIRSPTAYHICHNV